MVCSTESHLTMMIFMNKPETKLSALCLISARSVEPVPKTLRTSVFMERFMSDLRLNIIVVFYSLVIIIIFY
jgi:hypothetical protein